MRRAGLAGGLWMEWTVGWRIRLEEGAVPADSDDEVSRRPYVSMAATNWESRWPTRPKTP